ncbi:MAG: DNA-formamidopyrimidine glycosylase family protein [Planctomycetota bacterium]|nr:DNA-formamidopyrimidine glycosylase family protein [Planctomycetota bacterium]
MPEGHTIHRIARDHQQWFTGQKMAVDSPQGRFASEAKGLDGQTLREVTAKGKHLFYHWSNHRIIHIHLGLYGKFRVQPNPAIDPRGAVRLRMIGRDKTLDLNGPNCCELINHQHFTGILKRLGEDPLDPAASSAVVWNRLQKTRTAIGCLLLNQNIIAGIGNIYRTEILFLLGIHPETPSNQIRHQQFDQLWKLTVDLMNQGVKANRIITTRPRGKATGKRRLKPTEPMNIYKKNQCPNCKSQIVTWLLASRKIYVCPNCQPLKSQPTE